MRLSRNINGKTMRRESVADLHAYRGKLFGLREEHSRVGRFVRRDVVSFLQVRFKKRLCLADMVSGSNLQKF